MNTKIKEYKIRNFPLSDILNKIQKTELELFDLNPLESQHHFRIIGNNLVKEQFIKKEIFHQLLGNQYSYFGGNRHKPLDLINNLFFSERLSSSSNADIILVKNNLRAFYVRKKYPFCTKVLIGGVRKKENLKTDVTIRSGLSDNYFFKVPKIIEVFFESDPPFFTEELIYGRTIDEKKDMGLLIKAIGGIYDFYEDHGISFLKAKDLVSHKSINGISDSLKALNINIRDDLNYLLEKIDFLIADDRLLPLCFGHGDLSPGNMLVYKNSIYLLDWEKAGKMPIIFDLDKLATKYSGIWDFFEMRNNLIAKKHDVELFSFREQLLLNAIVKINSWKDMDTYYNITKAHNENRKNVIDYLEQIYILTKNPAL